MTIFSSAVIWRVPSLTSTRKSLLSAALTAIQERIQRGVSTHRLSVWLVKWRRPSHEFVGHDQCVVSGRAGQRYEQCPHCPRTVAQRCCTRADHLFQVLASCNLV